MVLEDISLTGARVRITDRRGGEGTPKKSSGIVLEWFGYEAFGDVSWAVGERIGIHFESLITPAVLIRTRDIGDEHLASKEAQVEMAAYMNDWVQGKVR